MNADCLISVVIPCYNARQVLPRAIQSVIAQSTPGTEIVVVDDQSTDDSLTVAESFANKFPAIHLLRQSENAGPAAARNLGLRHAKGRYVCFLDADDEYAPGFFATVLPLLEQDRQLCWVATNVALVNCHREVHPIQLEAIAGSLPSNLITRKVAVDLMGGFPEAPIFRRESAGEDLTFRYALAFWFRGLERPEKFLRYWVHRGSHFDYFLDRTQVVNGELVFTRLSTDEESGALNAVGRRYLDQVGRYVSVFASLRQVEDACPQVIHRAFEAVGALEELRASFDAVEGFLHPQEGFALYHLAKYGPARGAIVEIGSLFGRSTCWLAAGTRETRREKVVAVDHFRGSAEHQKDQPHCVAALAQTGTTLPSFLANLQKRNLRDWVDVRVADSVHVGATWQGPIRLLFIDGDHSYEATRADVETWSKHVVPGGIIAFHDVEVWPGVTQMYREFTASNPGWKEFFKVRSLWGVQREFG
jgi:glycosyltransferase involved in cell wall biosynthesis